MLAPLTGPSMTGTPAPWEHRAGLHLDVVCSTQRCTGRRSARGRPEDGAPLEKASPNAPKNGTLPGSIGVGVSPEL